MTNETEKTNIGALLGILALIAGCVFLFFPVLRIDIIGLEINYVYNNGEVADGIFIIICSVFALIALLGKKDALAFIPLVINGLILFNFYNKETELIEQYGMGEWTIFFYLHIACEVIAIICTIIAVATRKKPQKRMPVVLNSGYSYNQNMNYNPNMNYNNGQYYNNQPMMNQYQQPMQNNYQQPANYEGHSTSNLGYCTGCGERRTTSGPFCTKCGKRF